MAAMAAIGLFRLPELIRALTQRDLRPKLVRGGLVWLVAYHMIQSMVHRDLLVNKEITSVALYFLPMIAALLVIRGLPRLSVSPLWKPALACWAAINIAWLAHWGLTLDDSQYRASRWLAGNLPPGSVLMGDPAPGICLDNQFLTVPAIRNLCNTKRPLELFAGRPRYVAVVSDSPFKEQFWNRTYPGIFAAPLQFKSIHVLRWDVELYRAPAGKWVK
jgi:hypothetical protein